MAKDLSPLAFPDLSAWEAWLAAHGATSPGFWMKLAKRGATSPTLTKAQAVQGALRFGWIDGQLGKLDDEYFLTRFTPCRPRSRWSAVNRKTAERLIDAGRMREAGWREVEAARADGRWEAAYASQGTAEPPEDLIAALAASPKAGRVFDTIDRGNRYAIIYRVQSAKKPETRTRRIAQFVAMLERGEVLHPKKRERHP